jgi:hypothetical protein
MGFVAPALLPVLKRWREWPENKKPPLRMAQFQRLISKAQFSKTRFQSLISKADFKNLISKT